MEPVHIYKTFVSFGDTDASRRIYFASLFNIAHRAVEDFALSENNYKTWYANPKKEWSTPVRHAEAEYLSELNAGDKIDIHLFLEKVGNSSFTWRMEILHADGRPAGRVRVTHVTIDLKTGKTRPVPDELR